MTRTKTAALFTAMTLAAGALTGCGTKSKETNADKKWEVTENDNTETNETETTGIKNETEETEAEKETKTFTFSEVKNYKFWFGSGAGAWCTTLTIQPDGSFLGQYHDSNMGDTGEDYPNGIQYRCDFHGKFTEPVAKNNYTYQFEIDSIQYDRELGTEEITDGVKYIYSEAYGLEKAEEIYLYLPNAPVAELPQEYRDWVNYFELSDEKGAVLGTYGLYNTTTREGFTSSIISDTADIDAELTALEEVAQQMNVRLQSGELTQGDMNQLSKELYLLWDNELNSLWSQLKEKLDADAMKQLTDEEREWIQWKDQEVKAAGSEAEGGSLQPLLENDRAAELTRNRVYELAERLKSE